MKIKLGITTSRANIVEQALEGFEYTKADNADHLDCIDFVIEVNEMMSSTLLIRLFHAGIEVGEKIWKKEPKPLEFEGGQLNRTIELCQELDEIFSKCENEPYSEGQAAAYKNITQYLQFIKRLNTL